MTAKIPFGFRPDIEEKPEPEEDAKKQEISNTSCTTERKWSPVVEVPAQPCDTKWRRG